MKVRQSSLRGVFQNSYLVLSQSGRPAPNPAYIINALKVWVRPFVLETVAALSTLVGAVADASVAEFARWATFMDVAPIGGPPTLGVQAKGA